MVAVDPHDGFDVRPDMLFLHGQTVRDVAADVKLAADAGRTMLLAPSAYGPLCSWLPGKFVDVQRRTTSLFDAVGSQLERTARAVEDAAAQYGRSDSAAAANYRRLVTGARGLDSAR